MGGIPPRVAKSGGRPPRVVKKWGASPPGGILPGGHPPRRQSFAPVKVNIGLGKVYFFLVKGHFCSRKTGFVSGKVNFGSAGKPIWVGAKRILFRRFWFCEWQFHLVKGRFASAKIDCLSGKLNFGRATGDYVCKNECITSRFKYMSIIFYP